MGALLPCSGTEPSSDSPAACVFLCAPLDVFLVVPFKVCPPKRKAVRLVPPRSRPTGRLTRQGHAAAPMEPITLPEAHTRQRTSTPVDTARGDVTTPWPEADAIVNHASRCSALNLRAYLARDLDRTLFEGNTETPSQPPLRVHTALRTSKSVPRPTSRFEKVVGTHVVASSSLPF